MKPFMKTKALFLSFFILASVNLWLGKTNSVNHIDMAVSVATNSTVSDEGEKTEKAVIEAEKNLKEAINKYGETTIKAQEAREALDLAKSEHYGTQKIKIKNLLAQLDLKEEKTEAIAKACSDCKDNNELEPLRDFHGNVYDRSILIEGFCDGTQRVETIISEFLAIKSPTKQQKGKALKKARLNLSIISENRDDYNTEKLSEIESCFDDLESLLKKNSKVSFLKGLKKPLKDLMRLVSDTQKELKALEKTESSFDDSVSSFNFDFKLEGFSPRLIAEHARIQNETSKALNYLNYRKNSKDELLLNNFLDERVDELTEKFSQYLGATNRNQQRANNNQQANTDSNHGTYDQNPIRRKSQTPHDTHNTNSSVGSSQNSKLQSSKESSQKGAQTSNRRRSR